MNFLVYSLPFIESPAFPISTSMFDWNFFRRPPSFFMASNASLPPFFNPPFITYLFIVWRIFSIIPCIITAIYLVEVFVISHFVSVTENHIEGTSEDLADITQVISGIMSQRNFSYFGGQGATCLGAGTCPNAAVDAGAGRSSIPEICLQRTSPLMLISTSKSRSSRNKDESRFHSRDYRHDLKFGEGYLLLTNTPQQAAVWAAAIWLSIK
jgi:hypothetical protein